MYQTAGVERYVAIATETQQQWDALRGVVGGPLAAMNLGSLAERLAHDREIDAALEEWCAGQDPWDVVAKLETAGVPASVVLRPSDLHKDPQLVHRGFFVTCEHGAMGPTPYDGPATIFSATPPVLTAAPCLGEHNDEVLRGVLGLSDEQIAEYAAAGVFS